MNSPVGIAESQAKAKAEAAKQDPENRRHIKASRWWKKGPSDAQLDALIDLIVSRNDGDVLVVGNSGRTTLYTSQQLVSYGGAGRRLRREDWSDVMRSPDKNNFYLDVGAVGGLRRATKEAAVKALREHVDQAEFEDGPATEAHEDP